MQIRITPLLIADGDQVIGIARSLPGVARSIHILRVHHPRSRNELQPIN